MAPSPRVRLLVVGAGVLLATACGPRRVWMRDESDRIAEGMRPEPYTAQTPGAQGIQLGDDAPPLAPPFTRRDSFIYPGGIARTVPAEGVCCTNRGHGLHPRFIYNAGAARP